MWKRSIHLARTGAERVRGGWPLLVRAMAVSVALGLLAGSADAATRTWTGAVSGLWSDAGNWGGIAPVAGDDLVFPVGALNTTNTNDLPPGTMFNSVSLINPQGSYALTGSGILLGPGGMIIGGNVTLGLSLTLAADQTWSTDGSGGYWSDITGAVHLNGRTLTFNLP